MERSNSGTDRCGCRYIFDVGVPVTTLCNEVAESGSASAAQICETSAFAIIQLSPLFIILPFIILTLTDKHNLIKNLIIALWVGVISVAVQFVCGYYLGSETPAIIGSLAAIIAIIAYAKVFARKSKVRDKETFTLAFIPRSVPTSQSALPVVSTASYAPSAFTIPTPAAGEI